MTIRTTPCGWMLDMSCCTAWSDLTPEQQAFATSVATELVWRLSGSRFGLCETTVRPCRLPCTGAAAPAWPISGPLGGAFTPVLDGGNWLNMACGSCVTDCSCGELCEIALPGPVDSIVQVLVDGEPLSPSLYAVHDHRMLVRSPGEPVIIGWAAAVLTPGVSAVAPPVILNGPVVGVVGDEVQLGTGAYLITLGGPRNDPQIDLVFAGAGETAIVGPAPVVAFGPATLVGGVLTATGPGVVRLTYPDGTAGTAITATQPMLMRAVRWADPGAGSGCWPTCQDLSLPETELNTFAVTYLQGIPVPPGGIAAASALACELGKSCAGLSGCRLPRRISSIVREGVRLEFLDPMSFLADGLTGLYEVDLWIRAVNPNGLARSARVYSPDRRPPRTVTG